MVDHPGDGADVFGQLGVYLVLSPQVLNLHEDQFIRAHDGVERGLELMTDVGQHESIVTSLSLELFSFLNLGDVTEHVEIGTFELSALDDLTLQSE